MNRITLAVDPGTEKAGVSVFMGNRLKRVHLAKAVGGDFVLRSRIIASEINKWLKLTPMDAHQDPSLVPAAGLETLWGQIKAGGYDLVVEYPQVYKNGPGAKVAPDSVLAIATAVGAIVQALPDPGSLKTPRPREWKGQVDKGAMNTRTVMMLVADERSVLRAATGISTDDNVLDSVGLGIWAVGR